MKGHYRFKIVNCLFSKKLYFILFCFLNLLLTISLNAEDKLVSIDFSENLKIYIRNIKLKDAHIINNSFLKERFGLKENKNYWAWDLKEKIETFEKSGYIEKDSLKYSIKIVEGEIKFDLFMEYKEMPSISKIKITNYSSADADLLRDFLAENNIKEGDIANKKNFDKGKNDFLIYYQKEGLFLIKLIAELYPVDNSNNLILDIKILPIKMFTVGFIKVEGSKNLSYKTILSNLNFTYGHEIRNNKILDDSYVKIKQLGLFSKVFFKFKQEKSEEDKTTDVYDIIIIVEEVDFESFAFTTEIKKDLGPVFIAQYVNLNVAGERDRILFQLAYEADYSSFLFIAEYTKPDLFNRFFFSIRGEKKDFISLINSTTDKLDEIYTFRLSFGHTFFDFFSGYLVAKEKFYKESAVSHILKNKVPAPQDVKLKNKEFETEIGVLLSYDSLNDTFNPNRGIRTLLSYDVIPENVFLHKVNSQTDFYLAVSRSLILGFFLIGDYLYTENTSDSIYSYLNSRTTAQDRDLNMVRASLFGSIDLRIQLRAIHESAYFVVFFETGGLWEKLLDVNPEDLGFGVGIGLRWAPNKYHHSFLFGFPGSFNIGVKLSKNDYKSPTFTLLQHRDQYFYINLTGGF